MILSSKKVNQAMAEANFTNLDLSKKAKISLHTVNSARKERNIQAVSAGKVARALKVSVADLMD